MTKHEPFAENINLERSIGLRQADYIDAENERRKLQLYINLKLASQEIIQSHVFSSPTIYFNHSLAA